MLPAYNKNVKPTSSNISNGKVFGAHVLEVAWKHCKDENNKNFDTVHELGNLTAQASRETSSERWIMAFINFGSSQFLAAFHRGWANADESCSNERWCERLVHGKRPRSGTLLHHTATTSRSQIRRLATGRAFGGSATPNWFCAPEI